MDRPGVVPRGMVSGPAVGPVQDGGRLFLSAGGKYTAAASGMMPDSRK